MGRTRNEDRPREKVEVTNVREWMKCADCETISFRPLSGGEWEPYDPAQF